MTVKIHRSFVYERNILSIKKSNPTNTTSLGNQSAKSAISLYSEPKSFSNFWIFYREYERHIFL